MGLGRMAGMPDELESMETLSVLLSACVSLLALRDPTHRRRPAKQAWRIRPSSRRAPRQWLS